MMNTNDLWEQSPDSWSCRACGRSKQDIVRRSKSGQLVAKIVCHHDHIYEHVRKIFVPHMPELQKRFGITRFELEEQILKPIQCSAKAFFDCCICEDCNNADARAKKLVDAPSHVSFSPVDIRWFSKPVHDACHEIIRPALDQVWAKRKPQFELRDRYIDAHRKMMVEGAHWLQARPNAGMFHGQHPDLIGSDQEAA